MVVAITEDLTVEAVLEMSEEKRAVLVKHFGAGVTLPGQTWAQETLADASRIRGVDTQRLLDDLNGVPQAR